MRELDRVPTRIADHNEVANTAAEVHRAVDESAVRPRFACDCVNFVARVALKSEMVEGRFDGALCDDHNELRMLTGSRFWPEPDGCASLQSRTRRTMRLLWPNTGQSFARTLPISCWTDCTDGLQSMAGRRITTQVQEGSLLSRDGDIKVLEAPGLLGHRNLPAKKLIGELGKQQAGDTPDLPARLRVQATQYRPPRPCTINDRQHH